MTLCTVGTLYPTHCSPDVFTYWYQRLVAHILFTDPLVEASDYLISHLAEVLCAFVCVCVCVCVCERERKCV